MRVFVLTLHFEINKLFLQRFKLNLLDFKVYHALGMLVKSCDKWILKSKVNEKLTQKNLTVHSRHLVPTFFEILQLGLFPIRNNAQDLFVAIYNIQLKHVLLLSLKEKKWLVKINIISIS